MADYERSLTVHADPDRTFEYLADVSNLPKYFDRMTSAQAAGGDAVHVSADIGEGRKVEGDAWFRTQRDARRIEWGSEGPNDYHGWLQVDDGTEGGSSVTVRLSTERVATDEINDGLDRTLENIRAQLGV